MFENYYIELFYKISHFVLGSSFPNNELLTSTTNNFNTNGNKFSNFPMNIKFDQNFQLPPNFNLINNDNFSQLDNDPFYNLSTNNLVEGMKTDSINIRSANVRTTQRTMAFASSINGEMNPPVVMSEQTISHSTSEGVKNFNDKPNTNSKLPALPPALPAIGDGGGGGVKSMMKKLVFGKKVDDEKLRDNEK